MTLKDAIKERGLDAAPQFDQPRQSARRETPAAREERATLAQNDREAERMVRDAEKAKARLENETRAQAYQDRGVDYTKDVTGRAYPIESERNRVAGVSAGRLRADGTADDTSFDEGKVMAMKPRPVEPPEVVALRKTKSQLGEVTKFQKARVAEFDASAGKLLRADTKDDVETGPLSSTDQLEADSADTVGTIAGALTPGVSAGDASEKATKARAQLDDLVKQAQAAGADVRGVADLKTYREALRQQRQRILEDVTRSEAAQRTAEMAYGAKLAERYGFTDNGTPASMLKARAAMKQAAAAGDEEAVRVLAQRATESFSALDEAAQKRVAKFEPGFWTRVKDLGLSVAKGGQNVFEGIDTIVADVLGTGIRPIQSLADTAGAAAAAVANAAEGRSDLVGDVLSVTPGEGRSTVFADAQSDDLKARRAESRKAVAAAGEGKEGFEKFTAQFGTAFREGISDPVQFTNTLAEQAAMLVPSAAAGRLAAKLAPAAKAAQAARLAAIGTGAVMQGADVADDVKAEIGQVLAGMTAEDAAKVPGIATYLADGKSLEESKAQFLVDEARKAFALGAGASAAVNALPGNVEDIIGRMAAGQVKAGAQGGVKGAVAGAAKAAAVEPLTEIPEEIAGRAAVNRGVQQVDPSRRLDEGLGETAAQAAVGALGTGAVVGAADGSRRAAPPAQAQLAPSPAPEPTAPEQPAPVAESDTDPFSPALDDDLAAELAQSTAGMEEGQAAPTEPAPATPAPTSSSAPVATAPEPTALDNSQPESPTPSAAEAITPEPAETKEAETQGVAGAATESVAAPAPASPRPSVSPAKQEAPQAQPPRDEATTAREKPSTPEKLEGEKISREWTAFSPESGSLAIPRAEMPQVKAEARGALTNFLKARGITSEQGEVLPGTLKPTQAEYSQAKVNKARKFEGGDRAILVSSDNHVVDGHHQWMAKLTDKPSEPMRVIRLSAPVREVLSRVAEFPSVANAGGATPSQPPAATSDQPQETPKPTPAPAPAAGTTSKRPKASTPSPRPADVSKKDAKTNTSPAPIVARGANKPAEFVKQIARATGIKGTDTPIRAMFELSNRLHRAAPQAFEGMEVNALTEAEWKANPATGSQTPDSAAAYNPETNTLYLRTERVKQPTALVSALVHESGHFAERFALPEALVAREWAKLDDSQIEQAAADYNPDDQRSAAEIRKDSRARSEWVAQQFARVVAGKAKSVPSAIRARLEAFFAAMKEFASKWLGSDFAASPAFDREVLRVMGFDENAEPVTEAAPETPSAPSPSLPAAGGVTAPVSAAEPAPKKAKRKKADAKQGELDILGTPSDGAPMDQTAVPRDRKAFERGYVHVNIRGFAGDPGFGKIDVSRPVKGWVLPVGGSDMANTMSTRYGKPGAEVVWVPKEAITNQRGRPPQIKPGYMAKPEQVAVIRPENIRSNGTTDYYAVFFPGADAQTLGTPSEGNADPVPLTDAEKDAARRELAGDEGRTVLNPPKNAEVPGTEGRQRYRSHTDTLLERGYEAVDRVPYDVLTDAVAKDRAKAFRAAAGDSVAAAEVFNAASKLPGKVRVALGVELERELAARRHDKRLSAENRAEAAANFTRFSEALAALGTEAGQTSQAFNLVENVTSEEGALHAATNGAKQRQDQMMGPDGVKAEREIIDAMNAENSKVIDALLKDVKADVRKVKVTKKMVERTVGELPKNRKELDRAIRKAFDEANRRVADILRTHHTKVDAIGTSLVDKLTQEAGLTPADAEKLAEAVRTRLAARTDKAKREVLARLSRDKKGVARRVFTLVDRIVEMSNAGALDQPALRTRIAEELKLPRVTDALAARLKDLTDRAQRTPEGFQRDRIETDILDELRKVKGIGPVDIATAVYYANILSGYTTQLVNIISTGLNVAAELGNEVARSEADAALGRNGAKLGRATKQALAGLADGARTGFLQASSILKTGYATKAFDEKLPEVSPILELLAKEEAKGAMKGVKGYAMAARYVTRAMKAADAVFFRSASEAYQRVAAAKLAGALDRGMDRAEANRKIRDMLAISPADFEQARTQAREEGLTGLDYQLRVAEIVHQKRNPAIVADASRFAQAATFNSTPRGALGIIARKVGETAQAVPPLKLFVPFTNIVANVTNASLNYSPLGFARAARGFAGEKDMTAAERAKAGIPSLTDERASLAAKATAGTLAMVALLAYGLAGDDDDMPIITATGPKNPDQRNQLRRSGWKPHSVKIGDTYVSYLTSPAAVPLAFVGNWIDGIRYNGLSEKDLVGASTQAAVGIGSTITEMSFLSGVADLFDTLRGAPGASPEKWAGNVVTTALVPNLVRQVDRTFDPTLREAKTLGEQMQSAVPGLRQELPARLTPTGTPIESQPLGRFGGVATGDALWDTLNAKGAVISAVDSAKIDNRQATPAELRLIVAESGPRIEQRLRAALPSIQRMSNEQAAEFVKGVAREERARARQMLPALVRRSAPPVFGS